MSKVKLKGVNLVKFNDILDTLIPLTTNGSIYVKLSSRGIETDSHNDAGTIIKSLNIPLDKLCDESSGLSDEPIYVSFYNGKKVKQAFSYLSGNDITCEFSTFDHEGEQYTDYMRVKTSITSIKINCSDPNFGFANAPVDEIQEHLSAESPTNVFRLTSNEVIQVQKLSTIDTATSINIVVGSNVEFTSSGFDFKIASESEMETPTTIKISKDNFSLLNTNAYTVSISEDLDSVLFKSDDGELSTVITFDEDSEDYI